MRYPLPISWHVQDWTDSRVATYVQRVLPEFERVGFPFWIKGVDPPEQKPIWVTEHVNVLGRMYEDGVYGGNGSHLEDMAAGEDGAENFFALHWPHWKKRPWVRCWGIGNEPHPPGDRDFLRALNRFMVRLADLMHAAGLLCAGPNLSVGWPDIGDARLLGEGICAMDYLCLNEYSAPAMWTTSPWHVGRWELTINELIAAGYTNFGPVLIGETGIDGNVAPVYRPKTGWRTWAASEEEYVQQLVWQAKNHLDHLGRVESAFIFTVAPQGWGWDNFLPTTKLFDLLADAVVAGYEVEDVPVVPPAPAFDIINVAAELPTHSTKTYRGRAITDIDRIVIHHSGYSYPPDASYKQVRSHLDVIARYHINKKDWPGIAYHFVVDGVGRIWQTNSLGTTSFHAGVVNKRSVGICMLGAFHLDTVPTDAQLRAVNCLCQWIGLKVGNDAITIIPHKEVSSTACPGKWNRWKDKIVTEATGCFENKEDGVEEIRIVDQLGNTLDMTFEDVQKGWGLDIVRANPPVGATVWRIRTLIWDKSPNTDFRMYCMDENGDPLPGIVPLLGISRGPWSLDLASEGAPRFSEGNWGQPIDPGTGQPYPNVVLYHKDDNAKNMTNSAGYVSHSLGAGSNCVPPNPVYQYSWVMPGDNRDYSDWIRGVGGMWADHNGEHQMWWVGYTRETAKENGGGGQPGSGNYRVEVPEFEITIPVVISIPSMIINVQSVEE